MSMRILFVCLGNICRSPLAEAVFNHHVRKKGLEKHFIAESCGTANYHVGDAPDPRTIRNARINGITIEHVGQQFSARDFEKFDLILAMDESNHANIMRLPNAKAYQHKVRMMRSYDTQDQDADVPDPYYGTEADFQNVFDILDRSMAALVSELERDMAKI
jgi:protein-tyrosine phosphatase